ncbi:type II toxin-antitoxin system RelE/ParE family toxin [Pseudomonas sp. CC120222-01a]|uniref:type II toxin-antitoxin system RelE/ParE family toxin n=1 Tax=Pseudomonas sp. CC120222-01a TaxID=1378075 RepID=UPI000D849C4E|nr:type II toxin-antitoxin system RelE/ParE family toxin [Pseudomonas sp. CC120222-01a]PVZ41845.1 RelE toxin of RelEB toxin-antitoxin system [Pseudomonas sp. CC120222-01a]
MLFIETPVFTKRVKALLEDDTYRLLQVKLMSTPDAGDLIEGTGGLRKLRVAASGHGKRGGARVIYYHFNSDSQIAMLYIFPKNEHSDLSSEQRKALKNIIEYWRRT